MTPERWLEIGRRLEELESLKGRDRALRLDELGESDPDLRGALEDLLAQSEPDARPIVTIIEGQAADYVGSRPERVGRYRIVRRIGQGGMGVVFEAARVDDFSKRVALKLIRRELQSEALRSRFAHERQLLANLEHPNIARLLDGGETADGDPYLVLEFVDGEPFLQRCAAMSRAERLGVFLKVCAAVDHAHRNLVIHRDLKPGNILVTAEGEPKLLDFGIAKLVEADPHLTQTGMTALTPSYASPEQVLGRPMAVASDVYSLGVILYQLLTGRLPYDLTGATAAQIERIVCEHPPAPPGLGGDLDAILLMALRKEPARRYASASALADDIVRYLGRLPVRARPDSAVYRARLFVRRRWPALTAAGLVVLVLTAGIAATLYQAGVARDRFQQLRALAHAFVFDYADDLARIEGSTAVRERMTRTALAYLDALSHSAGADLSLREELAAAYAKVGDTQGFPVRPNLGHIDQALVSYGKAAALWDEVAAQVPRKAGAAAGFYIDYALLLTRAGDARAAARASDKASADLALAAKSGAADPYQLARSWCVLGDAAGLAQTQFADYHACRVAAEALARRNPTFDNRKLYLAGLIREGDAFSGIGHLDEAIATLGQVQAALDAEIAAHPLDPELRNRQTMLDQLFSKVYFNDIAPSLNAIDPSIAYSRRYLADATERVRRDPQNATALFSQAVALFRLSFPLKHRDPAAAERSARDAVRLFDQAVARGGATPLVLSRRARAERRLAEALLLRGEAGAAAPWAAQALAETRRAALAAPEDTDETANLILALITAGRVGDALSDRTAIDRLAEAEAIARRLHDAAPKDPPPVVLLVRARQELAEHFRAAGDPGEAERWTRAAREPWRDLDQGLPWVRHMAAGDAPLPR